MNKHDSEDSVIGYYLWPGGPVLPANNEEVKNLLDSGVPVVISNQNDELEIVQPDENLSRN